MGLLSVPEAEALLDKELAVLDQGFVRLVDYMGGDQRVVQAARVSYGGGTKSLREDKGLINYLYRNLHTSPFEQVILTFHCKLPIFVARQWIRHRTARLNELSGRYSVMKDEFYVPDLKRVKSQSDDNKQGSGESLPPQEAQRIINILLDEQDATYKNYSEMVEDGVARELARINLPLSLYTEWYWQIDLHNLFHFLRLRLDPHAQYEIRMYGKAMAKCAKAVAPLCYDAFEEFALHARRFSKREMVVLRKMLKQAGFDEDSDLGELTKMNERRKAEFLSKIWNLPPKSTEDEIKKVERGDG